MKREQLIIKNFGFSSVELMLSVSIFAMLVLAFSNIFVFGNESIFLSGNRNRANYLAEEGLEAVRSIRDNNFSSLTNGTHGLAISSNNWVLSGSSDTTDIFTRSLEITSIDSNTKEVTSTVSWDQNLQRTGEISLVTRFTNWLRTGIGNWAVISKPFFYNASGSQNGTKIQTQGDFVYFIRNDGTPDFFIFNISIPNTPTLSASLSLSGAPINIFVSGNYAYITNNSNTQELQIIDITNPASPSVAGTLNLAGNADTRGVFVSGNYAYVSRLNSADPEFYIVDITNPASPSLTGSLNLDGSAFEVVVSGNYAYVASGSDTQELQVINITNPSSPTLATSFNMSGTNDAITVSILNNTLFTGQTSFLRIFDITNPISPTLTSSLSVVGTLNDISLNLISNTHLFVGTSDANNEFKAINITNLTSPSILGSFNVAGTSPVLGVVYSILKDRVYAVSGSNNEEFLVFAPN